MAEGDGASRVGLGKTGIRPVLGVDLGMSFFSAAIYRDDKVELIPNEEGLERSPSFLSFAQNEPRILIGQAAKDQMDTNLVNTIYGVKRLIGRRFEDPSVQIDRTQFPFVVTNEGWVGIGRPKIQVTFHGRQHHYSPEELLGVFLRKLKEDAERYLGQEVTEAVVAVPTYFTNAQRQATLDAGTIAGLKVLRLVSENMAAALTHGLHQRPKSERNVLVFDMGSGSLDVSILTLKGGQFHVKATAGNTRLGGNDFDSLLMPFVLFMVRHKLKKRRLDAGALWKLRLACEEAKRTLSSELEATIHVPVVNIEWKVTRSEFERLSRELFRKAVFTVEICLGNANLEPNEIHEVVLIGGASRIPKLRELLSAFLKGAVRKELPEAVVRGAAVLGAILAKDDSPLLMDLQFIEAVPLSVCTDLLGGSINIMIQRNRTTATISRSLLDHQELIPTKSHLKIQVHEGEDEESARNGMLLGEVSLKVVPHQLQITFDMDPVGLLRAHTAVLGTGIAAEIEFTSDPTRLSADRIQRMKVQAEEQRATEAKLVERNLRRAEFLAYCEKAEARLRQLPSSSTIVTWREKKLVLEKCSSLIAWIQVHKLATLDMLCLKWEELKPLWNSISSRIPLDDELDLE